mmetsp:Transcript_10152/g.31061  ORF Transcript_10152/g.31061 Transcript_10152/m.31061 type:complete len:185 (+) Transcript_10152:135-689(+)
MSSAQAGREVVIAVAMLMMGAGVVMILVRCRIKWLWKCAARLRGELPDNGVRRQRRRLRPQAWTLPEAWKVWRRGGDGECRSYESMVSGLEDLARQSEDHPHLMEHEAVCSICLEALKDGPGCANQVPLNCGHLFHFDCICKWLQVARLPTCPCCKDKVIIQGANSRPPLLMVREVDLEAPDQV